MDTDNKKTLPKILDSKIVASSTLFNIEAVDLEFSNGQRRVFERFLGTRNSVMIVPIHQGDTLLLVREYALGTNRYEISFPKGVIDKGESIQDAANRELKEEVGFGANRFTLMKELSSSPAYAAGKMTMLLAEDLFPEKLSGDEPEDIEVIACKLAEIESFIEREDFSDARSVAAMFMVSQMYNKS